MKKHMDPHVTLRPFLLLWGSQSLSALGTAMTNYALVIWAYGENGTASSVTWLTLCAFLPTILFRFVAAAASDRWNKKHIMLLSDLLAACGTLAVLMLHASSALTLMHLYIINVLMSVMNAFQTPAAWVTTSLMVPKEHYARADGLQAVSNAAISILSPALGSVLLSLGGLNIVLAVDLLTFAIAFLTLLFLPVPEEKRPAQAEKERFLDSCLTGIRYLIRQPRLFRLILFIAAVNFLGKIGEDGLLSAFVLSSTGHDQTALGLVQSAVALGLIAGGSLSTLQKMIRASEGSIYACCGFIFFFAVCLPLGRNPLFWAAAAFGEYLSAAVMNVRWNTLMRTEVPTELQGRVYAARDTLQNCTIPLGLYGGGWLADHVFDPLMQEGTAVQQALSPLFLPGSGLAVQFFLVSAIGLLLSLIFLCKTRRSAKARSSTT